MHLTYLQAGAVSLAPGYAEAARHAIAEDRQTSDATAEAFAIDGAHLAPHPAPASTSSAGAFPGSSAPFPVSSAPFPVSSMPFPMMGGMRDQQQQASVHAAASAALSAAAVSLPMMMGMAPPAASMGFAPPFMSSNPMWAPPVVRLW
eukprot:scaffold38158_cov21-Tisochrysis_lutea.AAC.1